MKIILPPHKLISETVESWNEIREDAEKMIEYLERNDFEEGLFKSAFALAHCQVSHTPKRFFVINRTDKKMKKLFKKNVIINPIIEFKELRKKTEEGCLSLPYKGRYKIWRYDFIEVSYQYVGWFGKLKSKKEQCFGFKAQIFLHEVDHMNAIYG